MSHRLLPNGVDPIPRSPVDVHLAVFSTQVFPTTAGFNHGAECCRPSSVSCCLTYHLRRDQGSPFVLYIYICERCPGTFSESFRGSQGVPRDPLYRCERLVKRRRAIYPSFPGTEFLTIWPLITEVKLFELIDIMWSCGYRELSVSASMYFP